MNSRGKLLVSGIIVLLAVVGGLVWYVGNNKKVSPSKPIEEKALSAVFNDYKNGTYTIEGLPVTLKNGSYEQTIPDSSSKVLTQYFGNEAKGDLNGDGTEDIAFLLTQNPGGTGTFYYLAVALKIGNGYAPTGTVFLGDRIAPQTTEIKDGEVIVNFAERGSDESMTAKPSVGVSKYFRVQGEQLVEPMPGGNAY